MTKYDSSSLRELISDYSENPNDLNIIRLVKEADTSLVTNMENLFKDLKSFNIDISNWDVYKYAIKHILVLNRMKHSIQNPDHNLSC